ncbi:MAG: PHP domain-containing protein [Halobacteriota archaeon]
MVYADLHVHTQNSDGTLSIEAVPRAARAGSVAVVGVTDHDRPHPALEAPVVERDGVTIVHGIELRVETPTQRIDLLGYGLDPTPELRAETERLARNRRERAHEIVDCLEAELGCSLEFEIDGRTGRPHIARAVVEHPETDYEAVEGVFQELIGTDRPCFVPRAIPDFDRGVELLSGAADLLSLAHPFRYADPAAALARCGPLDAVERYYPYGRDVVDQSLLESAIEEHDLLVTGGSDAHGTEIGAAGLDRPDYESIAARISPEP